MEMLDFSCVCVNYNTACCRVGEQMNERVNKVDFCIADRDLQTDSFSLESCRSVKIVKLIFPVLLLNQWPM